jgi:hypothetical protein
MEVHSGFRPTVGPIEPPAQYNPLNDDWAVPGLRLRPGRPAQHDLFLGPSPEDTSWSDLGWASPAWPVDRV